MSYLTSSSVLRIKTTVNLIKRHVSLIIILFTGIFIEYQQHAFSKSSCAACQTRLWLRQVTYLHVVAVAPIPIQVESLWAPTHPWENNHTLRKVTVCQQQRDPRYQEFLWIGSIFKPCKSSQRIFSGLSSRDCLTLGAKGHSSLSLWQLFVIETLISHRLSTSWDNILPHSNSRCVRM